MFVFLCSALLAGAPPVVPGHDRTGDGELLLGELGCINCHAADPVTTARLIPRPGPILTGIGSRVRPGWIAALAADPGAVKPGTTMPNVMGHLPAEERTRVASAIEAFLGAGKRPAGKDADPAAVTRGKTLFQEVGCAACHGEQVSGAVPLGDLAKKYTAGTLAGFLQKPLDHRPAGRMPTLGLNEKEAADIAAYLAPTAGTEPATAAPDTALVAEGRKQFASLGCASCHEFESGGSFVRSTMQAPELAKLAGDRECRPAKWDLTPAQRAGLKGALGEISRPRELSASESLKRMLAALNCYACHRRDGIGAGGPVAVPEEDDGRPDKPISADELFRSTMPEFGDEGRVPPTLDGAGRKIRASYLRKMLAEGAHDRPYMKTRMPGFGPAQAATLTRLLESADGAKPSKPAATSVEAIRAEGRVLVGTGGLACVKCHNFNKEKAEGVPGMDLTIMAQRVRPEWFHAYMRDPQAIRPGTRMPNAWPKEGPSAIADVLGGDSDRQIEAIWAYLADGTRAAVPTGIGNRRSVELKPQGEPILQRGFFEYAGARGIVVGYPEKVNLAFDAEQCRLGAVWQGAFVDVGGQRRDRGGRFEHPLGTAVRVFPPGPAWAVLNDPAMAWPAQSADTKFRGYEYDPGRRPIFKYAVGGATIADVTVAAVFDGKAGFTRTMSLADVPAGLSFRVAVGTITRRDDGWYSIDGALRVRLRGGSARIRGDAPRQELIVDVAGTKELVEDLSW
ncbi:MAG: c-type cytochrome [Gemmataceae bacterium]|nr:c-type cytochrome [Gemmataceae bacterium]